MYSVYSHFVRYKYKVNFDYGKFNDIIKQVEAVASVKKDPSSGPHRVATSKTNSLAGLSSRHASQSVFSFSFLPTAPATVDFQP